MVPGVVLGVAIFVLLQIIIAVLVRIRRTRKRRTHSSSNGDQLQFPGGPRAWPIVGHLPMLMMQRGAPHQVLRDLCQKKGYGPIVGLRLGVHKAVIISSPALAKELLLTHDKVFANRVKYTFTELNYGFGRGMIFTSYNARWLWTRRLVTQELLAAKRLQELSHVLYDELRKLLHRLHCQSCTTQLAPVNVGDSMGHMIVDTVARHVQSKTLIDDPVAAQLPSLIRRGALEGLPTLGDFFPCLQFLLDALPRRRMRLLHHLIDHIFQSILDDRKALMATTPPDELPNDFLQVLLSAAEQGRGDEEQLFDSDLKALIGELYGASMHTTTATAEWAFAELLRKPEYLMRLREEVERVTADKSKKDSIVTDEDVQKMPFLESVVKETLRLHPVVPLLLPRVSSADCVIDGYFLPKGTQAIVNMWAIARDPSFWEEPESFHPERFMDGLIDAGGQHYQFLPFGSGRRMCPGVRLALFTLHVTLANLVKFFEWELPPGESPSTLDMSDSFAMGSSKRLPVLAILKLRHHPLP